MSYAERFEEFHARNPSVYEQIVQDARTWKAAGGTKIGIDLFIARIRWAGVVDNPVAGDFRINARSVPYYARLVMAQEPDLAGLFEIRESEADAWATRKFGRRAA